MSKGVCPYCLRDRLAHLFASSAAITTTRASSSSATTSPYFSGGSSPPPHHAALSADVSSVHVVGAGPSFVDVSAFSQPLMPTSANKKKPPTTTAGRQDEAAAQPARGNRAEVKRKKSGKKKKIGRFLSRLVGAEKRRHGAGDGDGGELFHSKTMKEKTASKWVFF